MKNDRKRLLSKRGGDEQVDVKSFYGDSLPPPALVYGKDAEGKKVVISNLAPHPYAKKGKQAPKRSATVTRWKRATQFYADQLDATNRDAMLETVGSKATSASMKKMFLEDATKQWPDLSEDAQNKYKNLETDDRDRYVKEVDAWNKANPDDILTMNKMGFAQRSKVKASADSKIIKKKARKQSIKESVQGPLKATKKSTTSKKGKKKVVQEEDEEEALSMSEGEDAADSEDFSDKDDGPALAYANDNDENKDENAGSDDDVSDEEMTHAVISDDEYETHVEAVKVTDKSRKTKKASPEVTEDSIKEGSTPKESLARATKRLKAASGTAVPVTQDGRAGRSRGRPTSDDLAPISKRDLPATAKHGRGKMGGKAGPAASKRGALATDEVEKEDVVLDKGEGDVKTGRGRSKAEQAVVEEMKKVMEKRNAAKRVDDEQDDVHEESLVPEEVKQVATKKSTPKRRGRQGPVKQDAEQVVDVKTVVKKSVTKKKGAAKKDVAEEEAHEEAEEEVVVKKVVAKKAVSKRTAKTSEPIEEKVIVEEVKKSVVTKAPGNKRIRKVSAEQVQEAVEVKVVAKQAVAKKSASRKGGK